MRNAGHPESRPAKGDRAHVGGGLRTREWDKDGVTMRRIEIVVCAGAVILLRPKPPEGDDDDDIPY